jgi:4-hydroxybenzoyl-CoA thioesterase
VVELSRPIKFEEVDAANIVFFARYLNYAHEAMEHFFAGLPGGYAGLIVGRRIGFPAVHAEVKFSAPVRFGDGLRIEIGVDRLGNRSAVFRYRMFRTSDGTLAADVSHTVVVSDLMALRSCEMPADVRDLLQAHLASS